MAFFDALTGSSQRKDMRRGHEDSSSKLRAAQTNIQAGGQRAINHLMPFAENEGRANTIYSNAIGVNGRDAQDDYWDNYASDPQREYDEGRAVDGVNRSMVARGLGNSGFAALAGARAGLDVGRDYSDRRLNRLMSAGDGRFAGQLAGLERGISNDMASNFEKQAANDQGLHQGLAQTRGMGWNNAMALGGLALQAFAPGAGGTSAAGNMAGGINKLFG